MLHLNLRGCLGSFAYCGGRYEPGARRPRGLTQSASPHRGWLLRSPLRASRRGTRLARLAKLPKQLLSRRPILTVLGVVAAFASVTARAGALEAHAAKTDAPCAVVEKFGGDIQILAPDRTLTSDLHVGTPIACGGWISTDSGWITVGHRNGANFTVGPKTFVGLRDERAPGRGTSVQGGQGDHVILYRGEVYGVAGRGHGPLNVITPNARARLARASAIVIYSSGDEETQLITLEDQASLENRFEPSRAIVVKQGEASTLNFRLLRAVPGAPRAIAQASLRPHLSALRVSPRERAKALANAFTRGERRLAAALPGGKADKNSDGTDKDRATLESERAPASTASGESYDRNPPDPNDAKLKQHLTDRIVGGDSGGGESILYPEHYAGKKLNAKIQVEDKDKSSTKEEESEKRRLIDALSKVNDD